MSDLQTNQVLREWQESASYLREHIGTIRAMFSPVTQAVIEDADIREGNVVLDVAAGPGEDPFSKIGPSQSAIDGV